MELDYLRELLDKQNELDAQAAEMTDLAGQSGLADSNLETLNRQRVYLSDERNEVGSDIEQAQAQQEFNAAANDATNMGMLEEIEALGNIEEPEQMATPQVTAPEGMMFDGGLQSNPDDNKYSSLQDLMRGVSVAPAVEEVPMSVGTPAELPNTLETEPEVTPPKIDIIEKVKQLKQANPDVPLSVLMEQAKKEKNDEEADLLYQRGLLEMLDIGADTKVDKSGIKAQLKNVQQNYKDNVAIAVQKNKEQEENKLNSKDSPITKTMRKIAKQLGIELDADMTAKDLMDSGLKLNTLVGLKSNQDVAKLAQKMKAKLNDQKDKKQVLKDASKLSETNKKYYLDMAQRVGALKRGSSFKDLDTKLNAVAEMRLKLDNAINGKIPLNRASAVDLSAVWSKALTGGIPAQGLIEQTLPISIKSDFARAVNYMSNQPVTNFISKDNLNLMKNQLDLLEKAVDIRKGEKLATVYNDYRTVIDSDPMFNEIINRNYGKYVKRNKDGFYQSTKALTTSGGATGKDQGSVIDKGAEAMIDKVMENAVRKNITLSREEAIKYLQDKGKL